MPAPPVGAQAGEQRAPLPDGRVRVVGGEAVGAHRRVRTTDDEQVAAAVGGPLVAVLPVPIWTVAFEDRCPGAHGQAGAKQRQPVIPSQALHEKTLG